MKLMTLSHSKVSLLCLILCIFHFSKAKQPAANGIFDLNHGQSFSEVPFQLLNDLIVVPVLVNEERKLNFILDTGTHSPIILNSKFVKGLDIQSAREIHFQGAGSGKLVEGQVISSMSLQIGDANASHIGGVLLKRNPLSNLYLKGVKIHGIIGTSLFRSFAVEIDYVRQMLRLHNNQDFLNEHSYSAHTMELEFNRPLLHTEVDFKESSYPLKLMIDTGFNNKMLIYDAQTVNYYPSGFKLIGKGYSGNVKASKVAVNSLKLANRQIFNIDTYFPSKHSYRKEVEKNYSSRDGIIGNALLKQFCVVLDYANEKFYLQEYLLFKPALAQDSEKIRK